MPEIDDILRRNPSAAAGYDDVQKVLQEMRRLRDAGFAPGPSLPRPPGGKTTMDALKALQLQRHFNFAKAR